MNNTVFSLRRLSDEARLHIIISFDYPELIAYSLISAKTNSLAQSLKTKIQEFAVYVRENTLGIGLYFNDDRAVSQFEIYNGGIARVAGDPIVSLDEIPISVQISSDRTGYGHIRRSTWRNPRLSLFGWLQHLRFLFTFSVSRLYIRMGDEIFDTVAIRNHLPEWKSVRVENSLLDNSQKCFKLFSACTENFEANLTHNLPQFPQKVGIQNFDEFTFYCPRTSPTKLEDLLILNARNIDVEHFSVADVNRFLKCWMKMSNPRMKTLIIHSTRVVNRNELMKGIKHKIMAEYQERMHDNDIPIAGAIEIRNMKGILAAIEIGNYLAPFIEMYIWD